MQSSQPIFTYTYTGNFTERTDRLSQYTTTVYRRIQCTELRSYVFPKFYGCPVFGTLDGPTQAVTDECSDSNEFDDQSTSPERHLEFDIHRCSRNACLLVLDDRSATEGISYARGVWMEIFANDSLGERSGSRLGRLTPMARQHDRRNIRTEPKL